MAPSPIDLSFYKLDICRMYVEEDQSLTSVQRYLQEANVRVSDRTLKRRLHEWDFSKRTRTEDTDALRKRMEILFYEIGLNDEMMIEVLQREGYSVGLCRLKRLRLVLSMNRRLRPDEFEEKEKRTEALIKEELGKGTIIPYGRRLLYDYMKSQGHIVAR